VGGYKIHEGYSKSFTSGGQLWCHTPVIPALGRLRQEDQKSKVSLGYVSVYCFCKNRFNLEK
jgi:hypothetical protein